MAYARYDRNCDWYIFWHSTEADHAHELAGTPKAKAEEVLAVWHSDHRAEGPSFTYAQVREMLEDSDFSRIPGFAELDRELIVECLSEFVRDVEKERQRPLTHR